MGALDSLGLPPMVGGLLLLLAAGAITWWLAGQVRRWALQKGLLDMPNSRSSHSVPVPRVGGLSVVLVVLTGFLLFGFLMPGVQPWFWILYASGTMIVGVGLLDDLFDMKKRVRLAFQFFAALLIVLWVGGELEIIFPRALDMTGPVAVLPVILYVMWSINAYNFMDGIDGMAAGQALFVGLAAGGIAFAGGYPPLAMTYLLLAGAAAGFLIWNWQPAKIFMGDLCSGFLGVTLATLSLWGKVTEAVPFTSFLILMGVFLTDPTYTVFRRLVGGHNITHTHRDFAFHHLVRRGWSHRRTVLAVQAVNLFWLLPLASFAAWLRSDWSLPVLVVAYVPLVVLAVVLRAGVPLADAPAGETD